MTHEVKNYEDVQIPNSLQFLVKGYGGYAVEVVNDRAIDGIDGFKPSQRRIMYTMKAIEKVKDMTKSQTIAGAVLKLHPHGDASVYDTMVRMTDESEYAPVPFLLGDGAFGKVYSTEPPAAARYTNVMFSPIAEELFKQMNGVKFIPSYDSKLTEPELLPVSFPTVLTTPVSGIAVGIATNRPSFNFHEANEMVIEYIENGTFSKYLIPDFTTGGCIVKDEKEFEKIMNTGRGRVKLRGKWFVDGKKIIIEEIPYYTTENALKKKIEDDIENGVSEVIIATDRNYGMRIEVECSNKKVVEDVLNQILRITDLQMTMTTNMVVIIDNKPRVIGVKELIAEWVKFREGVLSASLQQDSDYYAEQIARYSVFVSLLQDDDKRQRFTEILAKQGEIPARDLLREWFPDTPKAIFDWILDMKLKQFSGLGNRLDHLNNLKTTKAHIDKDLENVRGLIVRQLKEINSKYSYPRKTTITEEDYIFEDMEQVVVKAEAVPTIVQINGKFIKKIRHTRITDDVEGIRCMSDDVMSFIDSHGRLLRVALENLEFVTDAERGVYLPIYLETEDDFEVVAFEVIADKKVGYVYSDGFASVVDYSEWVDSKRTTRITQNGVSPLAGSVVGEIDFDFGYLMFVTEKGKFGFARTDFKQKHRTARTKLVGVKEGDQIVTVLPVTYKDILHLVTSPERYMGKVTTIAKDDTFNNEYFEELLNN